MKILTKDGSSPEASLLVSELLSDPRLQGELGRHGLQLGMCLSPPSTGDLVGQRAVSALSEHVTKDQPLCIVVSPSESRPPLSCRMGDTVCITPANISLNYNRSLKALSSPWWLRVWVQVRCDGASGGSRM